MTQQHKVFISYHHKNDQSYKEALFWINEQYNIFIDKSVNTGDIDENLSDQSIRSIIRDNYLRDSTVTIILVGSETRFRKHIDWELYSSMCDGIVNKKSGILVINLPSTGCTNVTAGHGQDEKQLIHPHITSWVTLNRSEYEQRYPYMPARIIDNLVGGKANISVIPWSLVEGDPNKLRLLVEFAHLDRQKIEYDLSRPMRRNNA